MNELTPDTDWQPQTDRALRRLQERYMRKRPFAARQVMAASLVLGVCGCVAAVTEFRGVSASDRILKDRQRAPDFALKDSQGTVIQLSSFKNQVVLVNFWATWCGGCQKEIPWLIDFEKKYGARGFTVVGISMDEEGFKLVRPFCAAKKINYPVVIGSDRLTKLYGVESMPETVLVDGSGKIAAFHIGVVDRNALEREIQALIH